MRGARPTPARLAGALVALLATGGCSWDWNSVEPLHDAGADAAMDAPPVDQDAPPPPPPACGAAGQPCCATGAACTGTAVCNAGMCAECAAGETVCNGRCVNLQTDDNNCGMCDVRCRGVRHCAAGACM